MKAKILPIRLDHISKKIQISFISLIISFAIVFAANAQTTVVEIIVNSTDHESLEDAVIAAELDGALSGTGPFTVFAPTDAAFAALGQETIDALFADPTGDLASILQYHVVSGSVMAGDLSDGQIVEMLEGTDAFVSLYSDMAYINQAMITVTDIMADNGVVHVIDAVITQPQSIVDIVVNSPRHEILEAGLIASDLVDALSVPSTFTLFAPTDDAFNALGQETIDALFADPTGDLADILNYHVIPQGAIFAAGFMDGQELVTLEGSTVSAMVNENGILINDAQVIFADYRESAFTGVLHVIDAVLTPPAIETNTVVDIIVNSEVHESLESAVIAADLDGALSGTGPFTVFAPTDAAFAALGQETIEALFADPTGDLSSILQYHVVSGSVMAEDLSDGQIVEMLEGTDAFVALYSEMAYINQAMITITDIMADNGVVHVIDAVITQPTSIVDIVVNSPRHTSLEAAVIAADLATALSAEGTFTLFAPTDDAFNALGQETIDALFADPTGDLADILKYHVAGATALSTDLLNGQTYTTLEGSEITITIEGDVMVDDAMVVFADYEAPNGVVHVIDAVIQPQTTTNLVENKLIVNDVNVYPNPTTDRINVRFELGNSSQVSIEVYDIIGQKVTDRSIGNLPVGFHDVAIGTEQMEDGIYILIVKSGSNAVAERVRVLK